MTLLEKVDQFIQNGSPRDQAALLSECLSARTIEAFLALQKMYEDNYGGFTFNFELKAPAAYCLIAWGVQGLEAIAEVVSRNPSSKNLSLAMEIFSCLASGQRPPATRSWLKDEQWLKAVEDSVADWHFLSTTAKLHLHKLILSIEDDNEAALIVGNSFSRSAFLNSSHAKQLFAALAARWLAFGERTLHGYKELIAAAPADESQFQRFFEAHPQLLDPIALQVWPMPDFHGFKEPDFVLRLSDNRYIIVEIECPAKKLITESTQLSAHATQAVTQVMQYRSFLMERFSEAATHFPEFQTPDCLVIIGMESSLSQEQRRALLLENQHRGSLRIVGFDWIASRAESIAKNIVEYGVDVRPMRMV